MEFGHENTAALIEIIKQLNDHNASLQKTVEELTADSKILSEQVCFIPVKSLIICSSFIKYYSKKHPFLRSSLIKFSH